MIRLPDDATIEEALSLLKSGNLVGVPAETVYGLAGDGLSERALAKIFAVKERPSFNPLILHLRGREDLEKFAIVPPALDDVLEVFWPGPLTVVLPRRRVVPDLACAGLPTAAFRVPSHPVFQRLLKKWGGPLAAPSANRSGRVSPTCAAHVEEELGGKIPLILDGGPCEKGIESTVVMPTVVAGELRLSILRPGPLTEADLAPYGRVELGRKADEGGHASPGQMLSHYAPNAAVCLVTREEIPALTGGNVGILWFTDSNEKVEAGAQLVLAPRTGTTEEAAARLYHCLRELDASGVSVILAENPPDHGLGAALRDRLTRAAAPR